MHFWETCVNALSMYSRIPMPRVEWSEKNSRYVYCFFPLVGVIAGVLMLLWFYLCQALRFGQVFAGAVFLFLPLLVSGGLHMDGFCDVSDAFASHRDREKMLEIMKDSHTGAFAVIYTVVYMILGFALWCEVTITLRTVGVLGLSLVLSRSLSGYAAVTRKNARGSGMLMSFSEPADKKTVKLTMLLWAGAAAAGSLLLSPVMGAMMVAGCGLTFLYYLTMTQRKFGGITGDLAGWFVQVCELAALLFVVLGQKLLLFIL